MKKDRLLLVTIFAVICSGSIFAFTTAPSADADAGVIMIRAFQYSAKDASVMHIYYGNSKVEEIKLEKLGVETQQKNWDLILNTINKFHKEGYRMVSANERGDNGFTSTYILSK